MSSPAHVGSVAHALVDALDGDQIELSDGVYRHFLRVLRLRPGEIVTVTDGRGGWRSTVVPSNFKDVPFLEATGELVQVRAPDVTIALGIAVPKGDKPEFVVQKLTELGVDEIWFFHGERSVARWDDKKIQRNLERLRSVAAEALQQSRGVLLPKIGWIPDLTAYVGSSGEKNGLDSGFELRRADLDGEPPGLEKSQFLIVGPEGGWSDRERELGRPMNLAGSILRAETAAMVGGAVLVALRSGVVRPA